MTLKFMMKLIIWGCLWWAIVLHLLLIVLVFQARLLMELPSIIRHLVKHYYMDKIMIYIANWAKKVFT